MNYFIPKPKDVAIYKLVNTIANIVIIIASILALLIAIRLLAPSTYGDHSTIQSENGQTTAKYSANDGNNKILKDL